VPAGCAACATSAESAELVPASGTSHLEVEVAVVDFTTSRDVAQETEEVSARGLAVSGDKPLLGCQSLLTRPGSACRTASTGLSISSSPRPAVLPSRPMPEKARLAQGLAHHEAVVLQVVALREQDVLIVDALHNDHHAVLSHARHVHCRTSACPTTARRCCTAAHRCRTSARRRTTVRCRSAARR